MISVRRITTQLEIKAEEAPEGFPSSSARSLGKPACCPILPFAATTPPSSSCEQRAISVPQLIHERLHLLLDELFSGPQCAVELHRCHQSPLQ
jgi:hypothetical protein